MVVQLMLTYLKIMEKLNSGNNLKIRQDTKRKWIKISKSHNLDIETKNLDAILLFVFKSKTI